MTEETGVRATLAGRPVEVRVDGDDVTVLDGNGRPLDPAAAEVIMALGGEEPLWLRVVEGLRAARQAGATPEQLAHAAERASRKRPTRSKEAATTDDPMLLVALAGAGEPNAARNPGCTPFVWDLLADHRDERVRRRALRVAEVLPPALAGHRDAVVRARVARNPLCPPEVLATLATDEKADVLAEVAGNPAAAPETLATLARRPFPAVEHSLARNPRTPPEVLSRLTRHADAPVRALVAQNPSLRRRDVLRLLLDANGSVLVGLSQRGDLGPRTLAWVERYARGKGAYTYRMVRWRLERHPNVSPRLLRRLTALQVWDASSPAPVSRGQKAAGAGLWVLAALASVVLVGGLGGLSSGVPGSGGVVWTGLALGGLAALGAVVLRRRRWAARVGPRFVVAAPRGPLLAVGMVAFAVVTPLVVVLPLVGLSLLLLTLAVCSVPLVVRRPAPASTRQAGPVKRRYSWGTFVAVSAALRIVSAMLHIGGDGDAEPRPTPTVSLPPEFFRQDPYGVLDTPRAEVVAARLATPLAPGDLTQARSDAAALAADCAAAVDEARALRGTTAGQALGAAYAPLRNALLEAARAQTVEEWNALVPTVSAAMARARSAAEAAR